MELCHLVRPEEFVKCKMNFSVLVAVILVAVDAASSSSICKLEARKLAANIKMKSIDQKLDHFDEKENATWKMQYLENSEHFEDGGPIFIFVGAEMFVSQDLLSDGLVPRMAKEHKGYLYSIYSRYYCDNFPTKDLSVENLKYFNTRQMLADLAHFIRNRTATVPGLAKSKVILTGGGFAGGLVIWFKRLYPELVTGCWASSPLLLAKTDFYEFFEDLGENIKLVGGETCYNRIKNTFAKHEEMVAAKDRDREIHSLLGICDTFNSSNPMDVLTLFRYLHSFITLWITYQETSLIPIYCKRILERDDDLLRFTKNVVMPNDSCKDVTYKTWLAELSDTKNEAYSRLSFYLMCNEIGRFQTTTSPNQPFGRSISLEGFLKICSDLFGNQFNLETINRKVEETNKIFGGLNPNVSDVFITQGQFNPFRRLGPRDPKQIEIIPMVSHVRDLSEPYEVDTPKMKPIVEKLFAKVRKWVKGDK